MTNEILFIPTANANAVIMSRQKTIVGTYCSLSGACPSDRCHAQCNVLVEARGHLEGTMLNSDARLLDGEMSAGIGEYKIGKNVLLKAMGLGSCVGVALFDYSTGISGMAHVLLPGASNDGKTKHAENAIRAMRDEMIEQGAVKRRIVAKFAGGAQIFKHMSLEMLQIGDRNIKSVEETLKRERIEIVGQDTGGEIGRNVLFNAIDGSMIIKYSNGKVLWI
ncbi:chemotaxis protein CheD [Methanohalophilus levihalophilus]|uniref:chemotaxis protein CheD n=1 Tax=Methanohalophilus levihalophilus TaxID=1431282 RepID=UPI001AE9291F|nr:chemotaxis protein CheD [Methanohalophilus levihalophilus]MBP2029989.1 chemotaxis protein CheD [Methanohalophilus levihalophilus]